MSRLLLVRHGQASFFADDYDRLSPLGERQARLLGELWGREGMILTEVCVGPRKRQRQTAEIAGDAVREFGLPWPSPVAFDNLDEYDLHGLTKTMAPELARKDASFAKLTQRYREARDEREKLKTFQTMFEALLAHWQDSADETAGVESWPAFGRRLQKFVDDLQSRSGKGARVAAFTSGGFIGRAVQATLGAPDRAALELNWRVLNGSVTEFAYTAERISLDCFNAVTHLNDPELRTYR